MLSSYILKIQMLKPIFRLCMTRTAPQFKPLIKFTYICYVLYFPFSHSYLYANSHIFKSRWPCRVADFAPDHFISNLTETERLLLETSMLEEETKAVKQYLWLQPIRVKQEQLIMRSCCILLLHRTLYTGSK